MKKLIYGLILSLVLAPMVQAATIYTDYTTIAQQNKVEQLFPLTITAATDGEITAESGINLLLDPDKFILWNKSKLTVTGSALSNGRIEAVITPTYLEDYKVLHIPVLSDWVAGESATFGGIEMRAYNRAFGSKYIGLDITGDQVADAQDVNEYSVTSDTRRDSVIPYPVEGLSYSVNNAKTEVMLSWQNPPDYDLVSSLVEKVLTRDGVTRPATEVLSGLLLKEYTDTDAEPGDVIEYLVSTRDSLNIGEKTSIVVDLGQTEEEVPVVEETGASEEEEVDVPETEADELRRLLNYYSVRYSIKCMPSGVAVAENNSACLWARIDLVYAQQVLSVQDGIDVSLSDRDLELMAARRRWPEERYETNCSMAAEPANYCSALGKALDRISYFLD